MNKSQAFTIERGQTIAFRVPSDTPDHVLKQLQKLKETEKRNFSSKMAEFVLRGVGQSISRERETVTIPIPQKLSKAQRDWLKHEHSEALLGSIMYQLLSNPVRSASLLASLNSNAVDMDQALYLQETPMTTVASSNEQQNLPKEKSIESDAQQENEDDLEHFDWEMAIKQDRNEEDASLANEEEDIEDLLGDFLAHMNK